MQRAGVLILRDTLIQRPVLLSLTILALGACSSIDYNFYPKNMFVSANKNKDIGVVHFHFQENGEPYDVRLRKVKGGYAMQAPVYEDEDGSFVRFTTSRTKSLEYFVGVEAKYTF